MDAQDDVADCFEYSKCNLNTKINRSNVMEMQDNLLIRFKLNDYQNLTKTNQEHAIETNI